MSSKLDAIDFFKNTVKIIRDELGLDEEDEIKEDDRLSYLGAESSDYVSIMHRIGVRPISRYFNAAVDSLTGHGVEAFENISLYLDSRANISASNRIKRLTKYGSLSEMVDELTVGDINVIAEYVEMQKTA